MRRDDRHRKICRAHVASFILARRPRKLVVRGGMFRCLHVVVRYIYIYIHIYAQEWSAPNFSQGVYVSQFYPCTSAQ